MSFARLAPLLGESGILLFPFGRRVVREPIARVDRLPKLRDEIVELIRRQRVARIPTRGHDLERSDTSRRCSFNCNKK